MTPPPAVTCDGALKFGLGRNSGRTEPYIHANRWPAVADKELCCHTVVRREEIAKKTRTQALTSERKLGKPLTFRPFELLLVSPLIRLLPSRPPTFIHPGPLFFFVRTNYQPKPAWLPMSWRINRTTNTIMIEPGVRHATSARYESLHTSPPPFPFSPSSVNIDE